MTVVGSRMIHTGASGRRVMQNTCRLVLIEGISGSGKSSTARFVHSQFESRGRSPRLVLEGDFSHPADYEASAYLDRKTLEKLGKAFPDQAEVLNSSAVDRGEGVVISYGLLMHETRGELPGKLLQELSRADVYEQDSLIFRRLIQDKWRDFASMKNQQSGINIFECCFLQNQVTTLKARHASSFKEILDHLDTISGYLAPLQPCLVYLYTEEVEKTLERVRIERPPEWGKFVTKYITEGPFGIAYNLKRDFSGVVEFYRIRQDLEMELLKKLPISFLVVNDTADWDQRYSAVMDYLG